MTRNLLVLIGAAVIGSGLVISAARFSRQSAAQRGAQGIQAVYICRETGELFVGHGESAPQIHPESGRATLWPAVYCPQCEIWSPSPPTERLYGHAELLDCPKCRTTRSFDGVIPEGATEF